MIGGGYRLAELAVDLLEAQIKSNIAAALLAVRTTRADAFVTTEPPAHTSYFIYETARVFRAPAIFVIMQNMDIRNESKGANHVNAMDQIIAAAVVEDRQEDRVTIKAYRYQAALMQCLHQVSLTSSDGAVRLFSRVQNCQFSANINLKDPNASDAVFRKEVSLRLQVEHVENFE